MQLPPLLQNKQIQYSLIGAGVILLLVVIALFSTSHVETVKQMPGQEAAPVAPEPPPAPPNASNSEIILQLFSPTDEQVGAQNQEATASRQIEQALTVSYVLTKCLVISQDDYSDTYRALLIYAQLSGLAPDPAAADEKLKEIVQAANASYSLIYSRTSCKDPHLPGLASQLLQWTNEIFKRKQ